MTEAWHVFFAVIAGAILGLVFYAGLWWTIRRGLHSQRPALWFLTSLVSRTALALLGFYIVYRDDWRRLVGCMTGFILARILVTLLTRTAPESAHPPLSARAS